MDLRKLGRVRELMMTVRTKIFFGHVVRKCKHGYRMVFCHLHANVRVFLSDCQPFEPVKIKSNLTEGRSEVKVKVA